LEASGLSVGLSLSEKTDSLDELRKRIERVTLEIFDLCGERLQLAKQIGEIKASEGIPVKNAKIEQKLGAKVLGQCKKHNLDEGFCLKILQLLLEESKQVQRDTIKTQR
jgi:chorismate mutase